MMGPPDADPEWLSRSPRAESCHPTGLTENGIVCPAPNDCSRRLLLCGKKRLPRSSCPLRRLPPDRSPMKEAPPGREDEDEDEEDPEPDRGRRRPPDGAGGGSQKQRSCAPPWKGDRAGSKRFRVYVPGRSELDAESEGERPRRDAAPRRCVATVRARRRGAEVRARWRAMVGEMHTGEGRYLFFHFHG